jgi:hypothetical protein
MKNLARRVRQLERRFPKPEPAPDLEFERAGWRTFGEQVVLSIATEYPEALARLPAILTEIEECVYGSKVPAEPGEEGRTSRRRGALYLLGERLAPYPEVRIRVGAELDRLIEQRHRASPRG